MISKSFIDLLFILLCATIVLLSESVQIGAIDTAPVQVGGNGISSININDVRVVVVDDEQLSLDHKQYKSPEQLLKSLQSGQCVVLVAATENLKHHRIMNVWDVLSSSGIEVKLGARRRGSRHMTANKDPQTKPEG